MARISTTVEHVLGDSNLFWRDHTMAFGDVIPWHVHPVFDHVTAVFSGLFQVEIRKGDEHLSRECGPGDRVVIYAGWEHRITCLEPGQASCIYAHRDPQGRVHQRYTGWEEAYR